MDWLEFENKAYNEGYNYVCGVDEAGRGPLAGPVCVSAVILPKNMIIDGVNDSKKLSEKKREELFDVIKSKALAYSIVLVDEKTIDKINILQATMQGMKQAVETLSIKPDYVLIDGNRMPDLNIKGETIVKGDAKSISVASASILAKVTRDRFMFEMAKKYPNYQFEKHKGYGTKLHKELLIEYGACEIHRKTFLTKILKES